MEKLKTFLLCITCLLPLEAFAQTGGVVIYGICCKDANDSKECCSYPNIWIVRNGVGICCAPNDEREPCQRLGCEDRGGVRVPDGASTICCHPRYPKIFAQGDDDYSSRSDAVSRACCKNVGGVYATYSGGGGGACCRAGTIYDIIDGAAQAECCHKVAGTAAAKLVNGVCCKSAGRGLDGEFSAACCNEFAYGQVTGNHVIVDGNKCCSNTLGTNFSGTEPCCNGIPYMVASESPDSAVPVYKCCKLGRTYQKILSLGIEGCCKANGKIYKVSADEQGCCDTGGDLYIKGSVTLPSGGRMKTMGCCEAGEKAFEKYSNSDVQECCSGERYTTAQNDEGAHVYSCCEKGKYVIGSHACCDNQDDAIYLPESSSNGDPNSPAGSLEYKCCPKPNAVVGSRCCVNSSASDTEGNLSKACCENAGGSWGSSDSSDSSAGPCCKGLLDLSSNSRTAACCKNAGGTWGSSDSSDSSAPCCKGLLDLFSNSRTPECCKNAGGTWGSSDSSDNSAGPCCKGSLDLSSNTRTEACCTNAGGKWNDGTCCATWGVKNEDGTCEGSFSDDEDVPS